MAQQFRVQRKVATVPITAGGFVTVDLPRAYDLESILMRISASLNVTVLATSVRAEAPTQLISRVDLTADGKTQIASAPFWFWSLGSYDRPLIESGARAVTPPSGVAVATYAVEAIGTIDLATVDGGRPKDSNLRTKDFSLFQLRLQFGNPGDPFVGGTVSFSGSPTVDIFVSEIVEVPDAEGKLPPIPFLRKVSFQELALAASNANQEVRLPAGNLIRSVFIRTDGTTTAGEPSATVLNNAQLVSGVDVRVNYSGAQLRAKNNADFGQLTAGYYVADFCALGQSAARLSELWDVTNQAEPKLIADVVGGANVKLQAVITEYIPAR